MIVALINFREAAIKPGFLTAEEFDAIVKPQDMIPPMKIISTFDAGELPCPSLTTKL